MYYKVNTSTILGLDIIPVTVEADISDGLPIFDMVGYLAGEVKEAKERVRTALKNAGFSLPPKRITINISPADIKKQGTAFDLPIALGIMCCIGLIPEKSLEGIVAMGELGLDGSIRGVPGVLPRVIKAKEDGIKNAYVPKDNVNEGAIVDGINVYGVSSIIEIYEHLNGSKVIDATYKKLSEILKSENSRFDVDFFDINGQVMVKRGFEIAASGLHNILLVGPPGAGKTMAAKRLPTIMPPLSENESLELTKIYSIKGNLPPEGIITKRPFISPHHTCTPQALVGGGTNPKPGAVSMAHKAVLFLDELPEFRKEALEILRQPLEDKQVNISRANASMTFPADFLLVGAMNPCRCGHFPDMTRCTCSQKDIRSYLGRISGPLLDRMDICIDTPEVKYAELSQMGNGETSQAIRERVLLARERQQFRFAGTPITANGQMRPKDILRFCKLGNREEMMLKDAFNRLELSARAYHKILKTARTIADMAESDKIKEEHLSEAIGYRSIDRRYWGM